MTILARLDHPNVVRCLACSEVDGQLVMAMELLNGITLRQLLKQRSRLGWKPAVGIAVQIASALAAAHCHEPPIVHRDLKPENVMILPDGTVKVTDFRSARGRGRRGGRARGPRVAQARCVPSPEQTDGADRQSQRSHRLGSPRNARRKPSEAASR
jgi:serine/threonine-protein kinase